VTTSVSIEDVHDEAALKDALQRTVDSVLSDAIGFRPTVVVVRQAMLIRGRLYLRLLVADQDGERTFQDLDRDRSASQSRRGQALARRLEDGGPEMAPQPPNARGRPGGAVARGRGAP